MPAFTELVQQGASNAWLFVPSAILLGALHGLEPGHAKTMMAAFIVAIHGTVGDAVLLGAAAALSHSLVVWALATAALVWGDQMIADGAEPYLLVASGLIVLAIAAAMALRHRHGAGTAHRHHDGAIHHHGYDHPHAGHHARAHAAAIASLAGPTLAGRGRPSTAQIGLFGLTGGLLPCPGAITVLLICLNIKRFDLGIAMVASFSLGLALTLVAVGTVAALGLRAAGAGSGRLARMAESLPYFSVAVMAVLAVVMIAGGVRQLV
jgi:nickel/cobalt exporter